MPQGQHLYPMVAEVVEVGGGTEVVGKEEVWTRGVACWGCLQWCCGSQVRWKLTWSHSLCREGGEESGRELDLVIISLGSTERTYKSRVFIHPPLPALMNS